MEDGISVWFGKNYLQSEVFNSEVQTSWNRSTFSEGLGCNPATVLDTWVGLRSLQH